MAHAPRKLAPTTFVVAPAGKSTVAVEFAHDGGGLGGPGRKGGTRRLYGVFVFRSFVISPTLSKISCDPRRDFAPVTLAVTTPTVPVVNPVVPAQSVHHIR